MPTLPIPLFAAIVLGFLFLRVCLTQRRVGPLALLLLMCAVQSLIISLAQHYQVPGMRPVQAISATLLPPLAYCAYQWTAVRPRRRQDLIHLAVPLAALVALFAFPPLLDVVISGAFIFYGAAILVHAAKGPDSQPQTALEGAEVPGLIWKVIAIAMMVSVLSDVLIIATEIAGMGHLRGWIISVFSVGNLILIGALSLSDPLRQTAEPVEETVQPQVTAAPDEAVWDQVEAYMAQERPYLDPDLTLQKLARKIGQPAKVVSQTINRATGENVSRYVNTARIKAAQAAMLEGENVTNAMLTSGFYTKSNFNREFLRVTGQSPRDWMAGQAVSR